MFSKFLKNGLLALFAMGASFSVQAESIKLAITDLVGLEELQREFGPFKNELEKVTGISQFQEGYRKPFG